MNKNTLIGYTIFTLALVGVVWLSFNDDSESRSAISPTDDYTTERSFEEYGDYDCSDFSSQAEAQAFFEAEGGTAYDYHDLDRDRDGIACESI